VKNILLILIVLLTVGCKNTTKNKPNPHRMELINCVDDCDKNYRVYTLEGCEYVVMSIGNSQWGSHKGNCKNPIHYKQ